MNETGWTDSKPYFLSPAPAEQTADMQQDVFGIIRIRGNEDVIRERTT